jgi:hypothetical protein
MQKRQTILLGVLVALIAVFLVWNVLLKNGDGAKKQVDAVTVTTDETPADPAAPVDPGQTVDPGAPAAEAPVVDVPFNPSAYRNPFERSG